MLPSLTSFVKFYSGSAAHFTSKGYVEKYEGPVALSFASEGQGDFYVRDRIIYQGGR